MAIEFRAIAGPTSRQLRGILAEQGVFQRRENAIISYGCYVANPRVPTLNANAGRQDKYRELAILEEKGIQVPLARIALPHVGEYLGRQLSHTRGKGINLYRNERRVGPDRGRPDYFTQLIPKVAEYRVWAFRRTPKALYQKVKRYPGRRRDGVVWSHGQGYAFDFCHPDERTVKQEEICRIGAQAVDALDLDFGAADIIMDREGRIYVLEVNTAPGVEGPRHGLTSLANSMVRWVNAGFPARKGTRERRAE